ncbi:SGNH/GDSL hydrolase family protein [Aeromonas caviae]|uniref:SGNH/GDSL hydrolase family protein n=1 Tax=Aeromonas caviae TaxID=648 RepID=UPI002B4732BB|nr:SGNH/GDSL hydrolase family protein [Aeromonas caviae]
MSDFDGILNPPADWPDVPQTSDVMRLLGGEGGPLNAQAEAIAARTKLLRANVSEALRRSYAEAGYNLVAGSFEDGGTLVNANDVLLHQFSGKAYSGPAGKVDAGTPPSSGAFSDKSGVIVSQYTTRNLVAAANFISKVQRDIGVKIVCRGDSLTYGEASTTGTQPADATPTTSGRVHTKKRASQTYPQALQEILQGVFGGTITVINQGYSGDNTAMGLSDWNISVSADLTIMMYGTNDAASGFSPYQTISDFVRNYELIIMREIGFGSAVVLMSPPEQKQITTNTRLLDGYRDAVRGLAKKYYLPYIDGSEVTRSFDSTVFDDNVHFKTQGYQKIAAAVAAFILSKLGDSYANAKNGSSFSVRFEESPIKHKLSEWGVQSAKSGQKSPPLTSFTGGYVIETNTYNSKVIIPFYADSDDVVVQPSFYLQNAQCIIEVDGAYGQMQYTLDDKNQPQVAAITDKPAASKSVSTVDSNKLFDRAATPVSEQKLIRIQVGQKGWHYLSMHIESNGSSGSPLLSIWGFSFFNYDTQDAMDKVRLVRIGAINPVGNVTPEYIGEEYLDTTSGEFNWYKATGLTSASWKLMTLATSNLVRSGAGNPNGSITPRFVGDEYLDTTAGLFAWYKATGTSNMSWKQITN